MAAQSNAERQAAYRQRNATGVTKTPNVTGSRKPRRSRKPTANQIASNIAGILSLGNATALQLAPSYAPDSLQEYEIDLLSKAAAAEILANVTLLKWYQSFGSSITGPHTLAAAAIIAVALPRLARRGMVPVHLAGMATNLALGMSNVAAGTDSVEPDASALPSEPGPAYGGDGGDGVGEVIPSASLASFEASPPHRSN